MEKEMVSKEVETSRARIVTYWVTTGIVALQVVSGAYFDLTGFPAFSQIATHLGYPTYLLSILGVLRIFALVALLIPHFPRLKEWTYAGLFFEFGIAVTSHIISGDSITVWISPLVFAGILITSWYLRPPTRRLGSITFFKPTYYGKQS